MTPPFVELERLFGEVFGSGVGVFQRQLGQHRTQFGEETSPLLSIGKFDGQEEAEVDIGILTEGDDGFGVQCLSDAPEIVVAPFGERL